MKTNILKSKCAPTGFTVLSHGQPLRRFSAKTKILKTTQLPLVKVDDWASEEQPDSKRQTYLITLAHLVKTHSQCGIRLVAPGSLSRKQIRDCILDACARPAHTNARSISRGECVTLGKLSVFMEYHQPKQNGSVFPHHHVAVLANSQFRFIPVKSALLKRHGLASHWSCSHVGYWSAVRYCYRPSLNKPEASLDKDYLVWPEDKHPPLHECCNEPMTAKALLKRVEKKSQAAAAKGKLTKLDELDVYPIVIDHGFRNKPDDATAHLQLIAFAKESCSVEMQKMIFRLDRRNLLSGLIDSIWKWEKVGDTLAFAKKSRIEILRDATQRPCACGGQWLAKVTESFIANGIDVKALCSDVFNSLLVGRSEAVLVIVMAGSRGGEGKSLFLKGLNAVYGTENVFGTPEAGTFPLVDLIGKKVAFLDDWRFDKATLPYATQCRWYDGSVLCVQRPQNQPGVTGHALYEGTAPLFATTKADDMKRLKRLSALDPVTGDPYDTNASMCFRRLKVYEYNTRITKSTTKIPYCARCFAQLVVSQATGV